MGTSAEQDPPGAGPGARQTGGAGAALDHAKLVGLARVLFTSVASPEELNAYAESVLFY